MDDGKQRLVKLWQQMYELTEPECATACRLPRTCCSPEYCTMAMQIAKEDWGIDLSDQVQDHPTLPFMGSNGCVLPPHLRPLCTLHTCDINGMGFKRNPKTDPEWDEKYWKLREEIEELEFKCRSGS